MLTTTSVNHQLAEPEMATYLLVRLSNEIYAIPSMAVREVVRWRPPTPVPGAPAVLPGIISQRGVILPVIMLRLLLGLPPSPPDRSARYVIVQHNDVDMALVVDAVLDLANVATTAFHPLPATLDAQRARLLCAITRLDDLPVAVIDLVALIATLRG